VPRVSSASASSKSVMYEVGPVSEWEKMPCSRAAGV
jgi:hypothetical protein